MPATAAPRGPHTSAVAHAEPRGRVPPGLDTVRGRSGHRDRTGVAGSVATVSSRVLCLLPVRPCQLLRMLIHVVLLLRGVRNSLRVRPRRLRLRRLSGVATAEDAAEVGG